uniref:Anoctamin n=1 Tax=Biomphalaria glabrata TaxID=6526 RepID=A0A2C9M9K5_BIOGL
MDVKSFKESTTLGGGKVNPHISQYSTVQFEDVVAASRMAARKMKKDHRAKAKKHPRHHLHPFEKRYSSLSEKNKLIPEKKCIDYVLIYTKNHEIDSSESNKIEQEKKANYRQRFEEKLKKEGFTIDEYEAHDHVYVKLYCPFKRLCKEAERVKLEMPLKDCKIPEPPPVGFIQKFADKYLETDGDIADFVSAPFRMSKIHLFDGHEDPGNFFRPSIRSLLVHHILINIDIASDRKDKNKTKNGIDAVQQEESRCLELCKSIVCFCKSAPLQPVDEQSGKAVKKKKKLYLVAEMCFQEESNEADISYHNDARSIISANANLDDEVDCHAACACATLADFKNKCGHSAFLQNGKSTLIYFSVLDLMFPPKKFIVNWFDHITDLEILVVSDEEYPCHSKNVPIKVGLQFLLMKNVYTDTLVLHDELTKTDLPSETQTVDKRKELDEKWSRFYKFQPMWQIRNYFGEKIGLYFAWTGVLITTLWIPMLFGVAVFIYGLYESLTDTATKPNATSLGLQDVLEDVKEAFDNDVTPFFALFICCWGTIFLEVWKRRCSFLAYEWDVDQFETNEPDRPQFYGTVVKRDPITDSLAWFYPFKLQLLKFSTSAAVLIFMVCVVVASVFAVIVYRVIMNIDYCPDLPNKECLLLTTIVSSILNAVSILILGKIYDKLAVVLTDWENHRTQTSYDDSLIIKLFAFQFVNSYASCFYVAFLRGNGSLFKDRYVDTCEGSCMAQLSFQILTLMIIKPFPKFFKDIGLPLLKKILICLRRLCCQKNQVELTEENSAQQSQELFLERERLKPDLDDFTMGEYTEKVILYGFLMLFACSFPLAPLMAIVICLIDIRVDAKRLLYLFRRPIAHIAEDIGMWYNILNFVNFVGVLTNAFIIAFTSSWGSQFDITGKLAVVIGFEHIVFILKFLLAYLIPDVSEDVKLAIRREKYLVQRKMDNESKPINDFTKLYPDEVINEEDSENDEKKDVSPARRKRHRKGNKKPVDEETEVQQINAFDEVSEIQDVPKMHSAFSTSDSRLVTKPKKNSYIDSVFHLKFRSSSFHKIPTDDSSTEILISEA